MKKNRLLFFVLFPIAISTFCVTSCNKKEDINDKNEILNLVSNSYQNMGELTKMSVHKEQYSRNVLGVREISYLSNYELYDENYFVYEIKTTILSTRPSEIELNGDSNFTTRNLFAEKYNYISVSRDVGTVYYKYPKSDATAKSQIESALKSNWNLYLNYSGYSLSVEYSGTKIGDEYELTTLIKTSHMSDIEETINIKGSYITSIYSIKREYLNADKDIKTSEENRLSFEYNTTKARDIHALRMMGELLLGARVNYIANDYNDVEKQANLNIQTETIFDNNQIMTLSLSMNTYSRNNNAYIVNKFDILPLYQNSMNDEDYNLVGEATSFSLNIDDCSLGDGVRYENNRFTANSDYLFLNINMTVSFENKKITILSINSFLATRAVPID